MDIFKLTHSFFMKNIGVLLILGLCTVVCVRPRCRSNFLFEAGKNNSNDDVYRTAWETPCSEKISSICTRNINITLSYMGMEPYSSQLPFNKTHWPSSGLMQQIISVALAECCGNCLNITFNEVKNRTALIAFKTKENSDILFPIFSQGRVYQINSTLPSMTIPLIELSSAMFITKSKISAKLFAKEVVMAIIDIWPLLGVAILMAFAAGVAIWITDTWWNKEHFPRRFVTGAFEGFWWAFISMTTVGYGDRVPKSVPGRLLSVLWILCGMTICALLTAALTTAIVTVAVQQRPSVNRGKVGILKDRVFEKSILMKGNADKKYLEDIWALSRAVESGDVEGMLLDIYTAKYHSIDISQELYVDSIIQDLDQSYLGVTVYDTELHNLIAEYIEFHKDYIKDFIFDTFRSREEFQGQEITSNLIFTTKSGMFEPVVYTCLIILCTSLLIGGIYEIYQLRKRKQLHRSRTLAKVTMKSLKKEESMLQDELTFVLKRWDKHLLSMMNAYSIEGMFTKSSSTFPNIVVKLSPFKAEKDYSADMPIIEEGSDASPPTPTDTIKKPKKKKKTNNKIKPLIDTVEDGPKDTKGYTKLVEDNNKASPVIGSKLKKKHVPIKKTKKKKKILSDEEVESYGTVNDGENVEINGYANSHLPKTRRLPPLNRVEDIV